MADSSPGRSTAPRLVGNLRNPHPAFPSAAPAGIPPERLISCATMVGGWVSTGTSNVDSVPSSQRSGSVSGNGPGKLEGRYCTQLWCSVQCFLLFVSEVAPNELNEPKWC